jgi:hypothetical protein
MATHTARTIALFETIRCELVKTLPVSLSKHQSNSSPSDSTPTQQELAEIILCTTKT